MANEWCDGFDAGHKRGFEAGFVMAMHHMRSLLFDMDNPDLVSKEYEAAFGELAKKKFAEYVAEQGATA